MSEHFDIEYKVRAREAAEKRQNIEELNRQDARDRGITSNSFGLASSSVGSHRTERWINGQQVHGQPVPQGRAQPKQEPIKFEPYLTPATEPPTNNQPTHHKPSVFNNRRQNHMGWEYSHNRPPREPVPEPKTTRASGRRKKS